MSSYPTRNREFQKNSKKNKKKKPLMASFQARIDWERLGERESKKKMFR